MKKYLMKVCILAVAILYACSPGSPSGTSGSVFSVNNTQKNETTEISISDNVVVTGSAGTLTGIVKKDKRKYYTSSNEMKYAVKFSEDGFKLRDHNEQLLWKVKIYDDKIKVSDNEEMTSAYEIKLRDEGKLKLERNESLITEVRLNATDEWLDIESYKVKGIGISLAPGLLLIKDLDEMEKIILMAEIRAKGR
jgi:hypothetical protein